MAEEILVNVTPQETRVASVENGVLQEVVVERSRSRGLVGNIYLARVSRVLPGMGAAFLDIGLERTGFLHVSDIAHANPSAESNGADIPIEQVLSEGQQLLIQVTKDPLGTKGARLTTFLSIPSRYLVLIPYSNSIGISMRIENESERQRLREMLVELEPALESVDHDTANGNDPSGGDPPRTRGDANSGNVGYIARTAAEGASRDEIRNDMQFLQRLWQSISSRIDATKVPAVIYEDLPLVLRTIRDLSSDQTEKIRIDSKETHAKVSEFAAKFTPDLVSRIEHYLGERPILDLYSTEDEIQRALQRKVNLKSGGHLIFDQTEAMTTIDVNTGGFVGHRNLEETIFKTNLEATHAIARQLRLRNLGGIIIVDFIDMTSEDHQRQVLRALEKSVARDHTRITMSEVTSLGLVQMTRKRTRESLEHVLCEQCPTCGGRGSIRSAESICYEIFREILREARQFDAQKLLVVASQTVVDMLLDEESTSVVELEEFICIPIRIQVESAYTQEQYDVVLL
ncbi:MAG: Rne/Rng family ribonuclease [Proteobacteria bacterium]|nr:MAG: Rne/Rng family ribonuclease [Pseudomonadota bacterium]